MMDPSQIIHWLTMSPLIPLCEDLLEIGMQLRICCTMFCIPASDGKLAMKDKYYLQIHFVPQRFLKLVCFLFSCTHLISYPFYVSLCVYVFFRRFLFSFSSLWTTLATFCYIELPVISSYSCFHVHYIAFLNSCTCYCFPLFQANKEQLVQLMFETFNISGFYASEQAVLSLYAVGRISGCTVDIGHGKIGIHTWMLWSISCHCIYLVPCVF